VAHDWRGHGLSERLHRDPLKGHGAGWRTYLADLRRVLDAFADRAPRPWLALGHSMGGGLVALAVAEGERRLAGAVLTAPMMGIALDVRPLGLAHAIAAVAARCGAAGLYAAGPGDPLGGTFEANVLTHDRVRWARTRTLLETHPELQLGGVTWGWLDFAFALTRRLARAPTLGIPCVVVSAGDERVVDNAASRAFAERTGARHVLVEGAFHEILMETDARRAVFWAEFDRLAATVTSPSG
jgi:lysophospholipase